MHDTLIAHLHPSGVIGVARLPDARDQLVRRGLARPHHDDPSLPWVTLTLDRARDATLAARLVRLAHRQHRGHRDDQASALPARCAAPAGGEPLHREPMASTAEP